MIDPTYLYPRIMSLIEAHTGEDNAVDWRQLLYEVQTYIPEARGVITAQRKLLDVIHDMRRVGYVIGSSQRGYFKPMSRDEAKGYLNFLASRATDLWVTFQAQRDAISSEYSELRQLELPFDLSQLNEGG